MLKQPLILIVDDELPILKTLKESLEDEGFFVQTLSDASKLCVMIGKIVPDLVLLDIFMPNQNGLTLLSQIKKEYPAQKVMMISGFGTIQIALQALKEGAVDFIEKPLNLDEILPKITAATTENNNPIKSSQKYESYGFIGQSNYFLELMRQIELAAPFNFPILLQGKSGVGKASLVYFIHQKSNFAQFPCITIDVTSLTEAKITKLFTEQKTIYLPHIEQLDLQLQQLLAKTIEQHTGIIRCIASTTQSLWHKLQTKECDPTLFRLLQTFPLEIPSLKNRSGDIPLLIHHFLEQANKEQNKNVSLSPSSIRLLRNKTWEKNNITELKNTINKLVLCAPLPIAQLTREDLLLILGEQEVDLIEEQLFSNFSTLEEATGTFEKKFILYLLQKNFYNMEKVADRLCITPMVLKNTLNRLNIELNV